MSVNLGGGVRLAAPPTLESPYSGTLPKALLLASPAPLLQPSPGPTTHSAPSRSLRSDCPPFLPYLCLCRANLISSMPGLGLPAGGPRNTGLGPCPPSGASEPPGEAGGVTRAWSEAGRAEGRVWAAVGGFQCLLSQAGVSSPPFPVQGKPKGLAFLLQLVQANSTN